MSERDGVRDGAQMMFIYTGKLPPPSLALLGTQAVCCEKAASAQSAVAQPTCATAAVAVVVAAMR